MRSFFSIVFVFLGISSAAQCFERNFAFKEGEQLRYEVYYNLGSVWLNAGFVEFSVFPKVYKGREIYHLNGIAETYKSYDWIYRIRDHYQSYLDKKTLLPLWYNCHNSEGELEADYQYEFNHNRRQVYSKTWHPERSYREDTLTIQSCTFDLMSLVYYVRNLDFSHMDINDSIPVNAFMDNEQSDIYIRHLGKEIIQTREGEAYRCIKFSALLGEGTIFRGGENLVVCVTDDNNRIPVLIEAKIQVGSIKIYLKSAVGLRNPQEARMIRKHKKP